MTGSRERHLALVAYSWGMIEQSHMIATCLAPAVADLREQGLRRFWFDRFDARGPHVFALFTVPAERFEAARAFVAERLAAYLADYPSRTELSADELAARHRACRGKALCEIDAEEGIAPNNTMRLCEQPGDRYPFSLGRGLAEPDRLWDLLDDSTAWVVDQLSTEAAAAPARAAAGWLAALFYALPRSFAEPHAYWRHHAASVIPRLESPADDSETVRRLTQALGESNEAALTKVWERARTEPPPWQGLPELVELVAGARDPGGAGPLELLREIVHVTLKQLGVPIRIQRTMLLFAWRESLKVRPRAADEPPG
jgi:hypothetical protein